MSAPIVAVYSLKGGVGKTTLAVNLAWAAAQAGRRVLLWDLDGQAAATYLLGHEMESGNAGATIRKGLDPARLIVPTAVPGLELLPADASLRDLDVTFHDLDKKKRLAKLAEKLPAGFDLVVLDCPPGLTDTSEQILRAADLVVVPVIPSPLSHRALAAIAEHVGERKGMRAPLLVSSADGVGTKIKLAIDADRRDTIGHDLVNHCTNDILVQGALPLFFLDYVAFGVLIPEVVESVVRGVAAGCRENGCALVGGETAEMPGVYTPPDYDLAGFIVGCVEESDVLGASRVRAGDVLIALASNGLHTNGYSLARRIVSERMRLGPHDTFPGSEGTVADVLLRVHRSYLAALRPVLGMVHAMAHITGGGIPGNLNRALPGDLDAIVHANSWTIPDEFLALEKAGGVARDEMLRAFNMGVGMIVLADAAAADSVIAHAAAAGVPAWVLGETRRGTGAVIFA